MALIIGLLVVGILLLLVEVFIPGGVIGFIGVVCLLTSIVLGFMRSVELGVIMTICAMIFGMAALVVWVKYFPDSVIGKKISLDKNAAGWEGYHQNQSLLGQVGVAQTRLRPSGMALINNERVSVVTRGELIEKGEAVKVIKVEGNRVIVSADSTEAPT